MSSQICSVASFREVYLFSRATLVKSCFHSRKKMPRLGRCHSHFSKANDFGTFSPTISTNFFSSQSSLHPSSSCIECRHSGLTFRLLDIKMSSSSAYRQKVSSSMLAGVDNYDIDDDFDDFSNDEDDAYIGLTTSLRSIKKSTIKYLNYSNTYVQNWGCKEAFRESYQNWYFDPT